MKICGRVAASSLLLAFAALAFGQTGALTPKQIYQRFRDSVVSIEVDTEDGLATGTGFFYQDGRTVVTCYHVIHRAKAIRIKGTNGAKWIPTHVSLNVAGDTAILFLGRDSGRRPFAHGNSNSVSTGDPIAVIGDPLGLNSTLSTGVVSSTRKANTIPLVQITAPISEGSSGSPVIDSRGHVIGLVSFYFSKGQNVNLAIGSPVIRWALTDYKPSTISALYSAFEKRGKDIEKYAEPSPASAEFSLKLGKYYGNVLKALIGWQNTWNVELGSKEPSADLKLETASRIFVTACSTSSLEEWPEWVEGDRSDNRPRRDLLQKLEPHLAEARLVAEKIAGTVKLLRKSILLKESNPELLSTVGEGWLGLANAVADGYQLIKTSPELSKINFLEGVPSCVKAYHLLQKYHACPETEEVGAALIATTYGKSQLQAGDVIMASRPINGVTWWPVTDYGELAAAELMAGDRTLVLQVKRGDALLEAFDTAEPHPIAQENLSRAISAIADYYSNAKLAQVRWLIKLPYLKNKDSEGVAQDAFKRYCQALAGESLQKAHIELAEGETVKFEEGIKPLIRQWEEKALKMSDALVSALKAEVPDTDARYTKLLNDFAVTVNEHMEAEDKLFRFIREQNWLIQDEFEVKLPKLVRVSRLLLAFGAYGDPDEENKIVVAIKNDLSKLEVGDQVVAVKANDKEMEILPYLEYLDASDSHNSDKVDLIVLRKGKRVLIPHSDKA